MSSRQPFRLGVLLAALVEAHAAAAQPAPDAPAPPPSPTESASPATTAVSAPPTPAAAPPTPTAPSKADTGDGKDSTSASASAYVIPDAPAFTILGVNPSSIDRPASLTKLGASLANVITPQGTVRSGVAIEASARAVGFSPSYYDYATGGWTRFLARLALSIGTVADSATATVPAQTHLAAGLRLVFIDDSDPLLDAAYRKAAHDAIDACKNVDFPQRADCETKAYSDNKNKFGTVRWNYGGLSAAVAQSFTFQEAQFKQGDAGRLGAWITGALPIGTSFQGALGGKYVRDFAGKISSATGSVRARVGGETFRGSLEGSYTYNHPKQVQVPRAQAILGAELKVSDSVWLSASVGGSIDQASSIASLFALSNIKWNIESKPSF